MEQITTRDELQITREELRAQSPKNSADYLDIVLCRVSAEAKKGAYEVIIPLPDDVYKGNELKKQLRSIYKNCVVEIVIKGFNQRCILISWA